MVVPLELLGHKWQLHLASVHSRVLEMTHALATLAFLSSLLISPSISADHSVQQAIPLIGRWRVTNSETLWTERYTNDDYGYSVLLSKGVVAHGTHPPSPNHGFFVPLPDVGKTTFSTFKTEKRYLWVDASYDTSDDQSLAD